MPHLDNLEFVISDNSSHPIFFRGRVDKGDYSPKPLADPDVRLFRIRLPTGLITQICFLPHFCFSDSIRHLSTVPISVSDIIRCSLLSSSIYRFPTSCFHRYYEAIRLPTYRLPHSLSACFGIPLIHYFPQTLLSG